MKKVRQATGPNFKKVMTDCAQTYAQAMAGVISLEEGHKTLQTFLALGLPFYKGLRGYAEAESTLERCVVQLSDLIKAGTPVTGREILPADIKPQASNGTISILVGGVTGHSAVGVKMVHASIKRTYESGKAWELEADDGKTCPFPISGLVPVEGSDGTYSMAEWFERRIGRQQLRWILAHMTISGKSNI